jgi:putative FmdB family regulatory protein
MPIYEYICQKCNHACELLVKSAGARPACPECGSKKLDRQFSTFAAHGGSSEKSPCENGACPNIGACPGGACPMG